MEKGGAERSIGVLQGQLEIITGLVNRVLDGQSDASAKQQAHAELDNRTFSELKDALGTHRDRIARVEVIADTVESHGDAILTMEKRLADAEMAVEVAAKIHEETTKAIKANNVKWIAAAGAVGSVAGAGAHGIWLKLWAGFASVFK